MNRHFFHLIAHGMVVVGLVVLLGMLAA